MRQRIINISRSWIGTPYHHQESVRGKGCDCLGLLRGVWRELYNSDDPEKMPNYSPSWGDHRVDDPLLKVAERYLRKTEIPKKGDVLFFRMRPSMAVKHCSILTEENMMIHAYSNHKVREEYFSEWWKKRHVASFEFLEVN